MRRIQNEFTCLQVDASERSDSLLQRKILISAESTNTKTGELSVLIGREHPHRFRNMSPAFLERFRFKCNDLTTASLRVLFGPDTDVPTICSMLAAPSSPRTSGPLILYRKDGEEVRCRIRVLPNDDNSTCTLDFDIECEGSSSFQEPCASLSAAGGEVAPPAADSQMCSLLSEEPAMDPLVAIHIRAVRCAAMEAAARPQHDEGAQGE